MFSLSNRPSYRERWRLDAAAGKEGSQTPRALFLAWDRSTRGDLHSEGFRQTSPRPRTAAAVGHGAQAAPPAATRTARNRQLPGWTRITPGNVGIQGPASGCSTVRDSASRGDVLVHRRVAQPVPVDQQAAQVLKYRGGSAQQLKRMSRKHGKWCSAGGPGGFYPCWCVLNSDAGPWCGVKHCSGLLIRLRMRLAELHVITRHDDVRNWKSGALQPQARPESGRRGDHATAK